LFGVLLANVFQNVFYLKIYLNNFLRNLFYNISISKQSKNIKEKKSSSIYWLKKISNFYVTENIFIDVDVKELNDVLRTSRHTEIDENDNIDEYQFN